MKKIIILLTILFLPINIYAYSKKIIPGGDTLGIEVNTNGIMLIGFYKVDNKYNKGNPELTNGDYIISVNNEEVNTVEDMTKIIENSENKDSIDIKYRHQNEIRKTRLPLIKEDGKYKTGLFVKSTIKGIGTLTYIDPSTKIYGALGHEITESETSDIVEIKSGIIFENEITSIEKSSPGNAGSKLGRFNYNNKFGTITKNTKYGIFGQYQGPLPNREIVNVSNNINLGKAYISTVLDGNNISNFDIEITSLNKDSETKNIIFKITDDNLYQKTGGVVQGMSGSPIIQNNNIVGVVTHVVVENPISGYGLLITNMLNESEKN